MIEKDEADCSCDEEGDEDCSCDGKNVKCDGESCKIVLDNDEEEEEEECDEACKLDEIEKLAVKIVLKGVENDKDEVDEEEA